MEKFILLFTFLTAQGAVAATTPTNEPISDIWYVVGSRSCQDSGESLQSLAQEDLKYKISEDKSELIVETLTEETDTEVEVGDVKTYSLTLYGKDAYLASPQFEGSNVNYFYVTVDSESKQVQMFVNDFMGTQCNGGLVVSSLVTK